MSKENFYQVIGNSIQKDKEKIDKLEKQNERLKVKNKKLKEEIKQLSKVKEDYINHLKEDTEMGKIAMQSK